MKLDEMKVKELFRTCTHQQDIIIALYKMVEPNFDHVRKFGDHPIISDATNDKLFRLFIAFDKKYHPEVLAGGAWMNTGFSTYHPKYKTSDLELWEYVPAENVLYKGQKNKIKKIIIDNCGSYIRVHVIRHFDLKRDCKYNLGSYWDITNNSLVRLYEALQDYTPEIKHYDNGGGTSFTYTFN